MTDSNRTRPDATTRDEERREAATTAHADRMPTAEEEKAAGRHDVDPDVARAAKEAAERGANQKGEGRIDK